ncbi:LuxR family quorum sensing-dependent transcriptional regulator [Rhodobium orientis]|nr:LuxR family transcriptional regulator [Rhodobium orientis]MBB4304343.1 LuxR family quorum sensing-dependent transcriptional regulator [Rhodobium orientis]
MNELDLAMSFVEDVKKKTSIDDVRDQFARTITAFGFKSYLIAGVPLPGERLDDYHMASGLPLSWFERYMQENYVGEDPVVKRLRSSAQPFVWRDTLNDRTTNELGTKIMNEAHEHGLGDGFCVPIHGADGFQAGVSLGAPDVDLSERHRGALHLISIYVHNQIRELLMRNRVELPSVRLTPRELECLKWTSAGKTSWEISKILNISQHTVDWYLGSLGRKLGAVNRTQAVAEGFRRGFLH